MQDLTIVWFRRDLRIHDNAALAAAVARGTGILPVFIRAPDEETPWAPGAASDWWLHFALESLSQELRKHGLPLLIVKGPTIDALMSLVRKFHVSAVFFNRCYEPTLLRRDNSVCEVLQAIGVGSRGYDANLLFQPGEIRNKAGQAFRVFTPFWNQLQRLTRKVPVEFDLSSSDSPNLDRAEDQLSGLELLPRHNWASAFHSKWNPTLSGAAHALTGFCQHSLQTYVTDRDFPALEGTSTLSPFLHFGQLSPSMVWDRLSHEDAVSSTARTGFLRQLAWREFAYHLLFHFPDTPEQALQPAYRNFPYQPDEHYLTAWQKGETGFPMVDAGMRQLWSIGYMHNRVRMLVASFLVKHLLQPWQQGAAWFWDTLVDADLANNTMGWQWAAGCGADAAPYFRVFNPILQGEKFDPDGAYVKRWVPELKGLPSRYIHQPWNAPEDTLNNAGVKLGQQYPLPVISHKAGRERALQALAQNKSSGKST